MLIGMTFIVAGKNTFCSPCKNNSAWRLSS